MRKTKKKEFKYLKQILIPCLSVGAISSVAIPMAILNTRHYVSIPFKLLDVYFTGPTFTYSFNLNSKLEDGQKIIVTSKRSSFYAYNCWLEPTSSEPIIPPEKSFNVEMSFKSTSQEITSGMGGTDFYFTCIDKDNNIVWKDSIKAAQFNRGK